MELTESFTTCPAWPCRLISSHFAFYAPSKQNFFKLLCSSLKAPFSLLPCRFCTGDCSQHSTVQVSDWMLPPGSLQWSIKWGFDASSVNSHSTLDLTSTVFIMLCCNYLVLHLVPPSNTHFQWGRNQAYLARCSLLSTYAW